MKRRRLNIKKEISELRKMDNFKKRVLRGKKKYGYTGANKKRAKKSIETGTQPIESIGDDVGEVGETDKQSLES